MINFEYAKAGSIEDAMNRTVSGASAAAKFLAGGTSLIDLMKLEVEMPEQIVDIRLLGLNEIKKMKDGRLEAGALATNADVANHAMIRRDYPVLSQAILAGASPQLRNKATTAGNLLQRTRCIYFRDNSKPCNKRTPGSGCSAITGHNRNLAILGTSGACIATNPSDQNVALTALEAKVRVRSPQGEREIDISEFYLVPGETPHKETTLAPGEIITSVLLPAPIEGAKSHYLKLRDRASYEFALASVAVIAKLKAGKIEKIRLAMGGVATKPWRLSDAEKILAGAAPSDSLFKQAAEVTFKPAKAHSENGFKIELGQRALVHALKHVTEMARS